MQSLNKIPDSVEGYEVLYFPDAHIEKIHGPDSSFAAYGPLSVLYFPTYNRFVLVLNDWKYPLVRRLPVTLTSSKTDIGSRNYILPATNGARFSLTLNNLYNLHGLVNFETILEENSVFSFLGNEINAKKHEMSPDDKVVRHPMEKKKSGGFGSVLKSATDKMMSTVETITSETKKLVGPKHTRSKSLQLKEIKTENFRKKAKSTLKKEFFESNEKRVKELEEMRKNNVNLNQSRTYSDLKKHDHIPLFYSKRAEIEDAILTNKDIAVKGGLDLTPDYNEGPPHRLVSSFEDIPEATSVSYSRVGQGPLEAHSRSRLVKNLEGKYIKLDSFETYEA